MRIEMADAKCQVLGVGVVYASCCHVSRWQLLFLSSDAGREQLLGPDIHRSYALSRAWPRSVKMCGEITNVTPNYV